MSVFRELKRAGGKILKKITSPLSLTLKGVSKRIAGNQRTMTEIPEEDKITALVAQQVYKAPSIRQSVLLDFSLVQNYNAVKHCVYKNDTRKELVMGLRGTADAEDLANDALIVRSDAENMFGEKNIKFNQSYRVGEADTLFRTLRKAFPAYKIIVAGHSLAGRMTMELARNHQREGINNSRYVGYNAGGFPLSVGQYPKERTRIYLTGSDVLSFGWNRHPNAYIVDRKDKEIGNNHSIDYFV